MTDIELGPVPTPPEENKGVLGKTGDWISNNRVVTGMVAGAVAGTAIVPIVGTAFGTIIGGVGGWWSSKEAEKRKVKQFYGFTNSANQEADDVAGFATVAFIVVAIFGFAIWAFFA